MSHRTLALLALTLAAALPSRAALAPSAEEATALPVGAKAPTAVLVTANRKQLDLAQAFHEKPTVLVFYRGGWCPFCSRHLSELGDIELELRKLGFQIIAITPEPPEKLTPTVKDTNVRFQLLSDSATLVARAFGVAYHISNETGKNYRENGIELTPLDDGSGYWLPIPSAFIITPDATVRFAFSNADPSIRVSGTELLAAARAVVAQK